MAVMQVAFYKGRSRLFNRLVSWWTRGPYSHCELIVEYMPNGAAVCWSSSFLDGGVRRKVMKLNPEHWDVVQLEVDAVDLIRAQAWFEQRAGAGYDVLGLLGFVWRAAKDHALRWFCSEAVAAALGYAQAWRFSPNDLYPILALKGSNHV